MAQLTINQPQGPAEEARQSPQGSGWQPVNLQEYEAYAASVLPRASWGFYASGANDMVTLRANRSAYERLRLRPRILRDVSQIDLSTSLLGQAVDMPIQVAPCSMHGFAHPDAEVATAKAAARHGVIMTLSSLSNASLEAVAEASFSSPKWFQLYVYKRRWFSSVCSKDGDITKALVARVAKAGYKALVLTVDATVHGKREADIRNRFSLPSHLKLGSFEGLVAEGIDEIEDGSGLAKYVASFMDESLSWKDLAWLKSICPVPVVVKGIMTAEDAFLAIQHGAKAIWISNHGGRQLDTTAASIEVLPEIMQAFKDRRRRLRDSGGEEEEEEIEVYVDGGIMRGTDVIKALALGAKAVFVARPVLWGLAHNGTEGVYNVLNLLKDELRLGMQLMGATHVKDLGPHSITHASSYYHSKF